VRVVVLPLVVVQSSFPLQLKPEKDFQRNTEQSQSGVGTTYSDKNHRCLCSRAGMAL
jgi:hypothetical protein